MICFFRVLETIVDPRHELARLSFIVDWNGLEADLSGYYCADNGRALVSVDKIDVWPLFSKRFQRTFG